jgi:hypothetical protein
MLFTVLKGFAVFVGGPVIAFASLSIGCDGPDPALGVACGHNAIVSLLGLTIAVWFVLIMALTVHSATKKNL